MVDDTMKMKVSGSQIFYRGVKQYNCPEPVASKKKSFRV
jgi:hypothetical protein